eukprot:11728635-Heterocapsa_arctica.AAC.1
MRAAIEQISVATSLTTFTHIAELTEQLHAASLILQTQDVPLHSRFAKGRAALMDVDQQLEDIA